MSARLRVFEARYLQGIASGEIIDTVHTRRAPMIPVSAAP